MDGALNAVLACPADHFSGFVSRFDRLVTVDVPPLAPRLVQQALAAGSACALSLRAQGLICSAVLVCQNQYLAIDAMKNHMQNKALTLAGLATEFA